MHAQLQISLLMRFLSLLHYASQCPFGNDMCRLLVQQFLNLFAQFKTTKSHENYVFLYPFSNMAISPQINEKTVFYIGKLYGLTSMYCSLPLLFIFGVNVCFLFSFIIFHCYVLTSDSLTKLTGLFQIQFLGSCSLSTDWKSV